MLKLCVLDLHGQLVQEKEDGWPKLLDIYFEDNQTIAYSFEEAITIEKTGMYYLWFVICDEYLSAATVRGQTTWKNPMGYLPGMMYPHIKFFGVMSLLYMTLSVGWMLLYARHWQVCFLSDFLTRLCNIDLGRHSQLLACCA